MTADHGDPTPTVQKKRQRNNHIRIITQNVQVCSSEFFKWKRDGIVEDMQQHNTDVTCIQETGDHEDEDIKVHDHLPLMYGTSPTGKISRGGLEIILSPHAQKDCKLSGHPDPIRYGLLVDIARIIAITLL